MDPNGVLDVVIGLVLMYLALSVMCTVVNELIATIMALRAKSLAAGICQLIDNPNLLAAFYNHGMIDGTKGASAGGLGASPANHPSYLSGRVFAMALLGSLDPTKPLPAFADVEGSIRHLPDSNIRDVLLVHVVAAEKDLSSLRDGIATWFDQTMDRLGGSYKRKLKTISFVVGLVLAVGINADTVAVSRALWHDSALRDQMVKFASRQVASAPAASPAVVPGGTSTPATGSAAAPADLSASFKELRLAEEDVRPLPIGWSFGKKAPAHPVADKASPGAGAPVDAASAGDDGSRDSEIRILDIVIKAVGLVLTALALTLGAPFWFDVLSKFINLRGTGEKPARTLGS
jgi:hypothetical protein